MAEYKNSMSENSKSGDGDGVPHQWDWDGPARFIESRHRKRTGFHGVILLCLCLFLYFSFPSGLVRPWRRYGQTHHCTDGSAEKEITDFRDITPSEKLEWHTCFGGYQCARLTVPMDYNRPLNVSKHHPKVHIALGMVPGVGHTESGRYSQSPLLLNPGGPGGGGVDFSFGIGHQLQRAISADGSQDIIGFDPRGVGETTPVADCWSFPSGKDGKHVSDDDVKRGFFNQMIFTLMGTDDGLVNSSSDSLVKLDRRARTEALMCQQHDAVYGDASILRHLSTPAVAQDMLSIVTAWDQWRRESGQEDGSTQLAATSHERSPPTDDNVYDFDTKGKLLYMGFSYGTLLGATFAAMFPDRVGRMVLDGVVDADYYVSPVWAESLHDSDAIFDSFHYYCHQAESDCALYRTGDTERDIRDRVAGIFEALTAHPITAITPSDYFPFSFTHDHLKAWAFLALYWPIRVFPSLALVLDMLERHDIIELTSAVGLFHPSFEPLCSSQPLRGLGNAHLPIMCSDKRYPLNESIPNLEQRFERMAKQSWFADLWMSAMIGCDGWAVKPTDPPMRWDDHPAHRQKPINTSFPLLYLSNTLDPVTPLIAGVKMARKFVDAGFLEQQGEGHCTLSQYSACTALTIMAYFQHGLVPPVPEWGPSGEEVEKGNWTRCPADEYPWKRQTSQQLRLHYESQGSSYEPEQVERLLAWKEVQEAARAYIRPASVIRGVFQGTPDAIPWL